MPRTNDEDLTPGRDALALCLIGLNGAYLSKFDMHSMPDEWQALTAQLINKTKTNITKPNETAPANR